MRPGYFTRDTAPKTAIVACGVRLYERGFAAANDGNLSVRVSDREIWTTPTGVSKGYMSEEILVRVSLDGEILEGNRAPSSELPLHLGIYRENPDIRAVVHAHPPAATAFAAAGLPLDKPVLQEAVVQLGTVPLAPFALPGSAEVALGVIPFCRSNKGVLLEYHGACTWGGDLEEALYRMECVEQYATVLLHLQTLGSSRVMPEALVTELHTLRAKLRL